MATLNQKVATRFTHEGAPAKGISLEDELRRTVMACLLWEDSFYENGVQVGERIKTLVHKLDGRVVADIAIAARNKMKLRHVPLMIARELARHPNKTARTYVADLLYDIIQRPDELTEYVAIYCKEAREQLSAQSKRGLAKAFTKFNEYALAKYNRDGKYKLRDVLFLTHPKPTDEAQAELWKRLVDKKLETPDTWETNLSAGKDKKETWERLIEEGKLGGLATLRNLRNMLNVGVDDATIRKALTTMNAEKVLPFRFITAARYAPRFEPELESAMFKCLESHPKLAGKTILLVDHSGSMSHLLSAKSELTRFEAAAALAMLLREICEDVEIGAFSNDATWVPPRRGFALRDALNDAGEWGGTYTQRAVAAANRKRYDRLIVLTDEQSHQKLSDPKGIGYVVNVGTYQNGVGYGAWNHIDGWSEAIVDYVMQLEG